MKKIYSIIVLCLFAISLCACNINTNTIELPTQTEIVELDNGHLSTAEENTLQEKVTEEIPSDNIEVIHDFLNNDGFNSIDFSLCDVENLRVLKNGDVYQAFFDFNGGHFEVRMAHTDNLENISGVTPPSTADYDNSFNNGVSFGESYYWVNGAALSTLDIMFDTVNKVSFTQFTDNTPIGEQPLVFKVSEDGSRWTNIYKPQNINHDKIEMNVARLVVDGEKKEYQYRVGMTIGQWVNSELNTDGWHYSENEKNVVLNANNTVYSWDDMKIASFLPLMPLENNSYPGSSNDLQSNVSLGYKNGMVYCHDSHSPLFIEGCYFTGSDTNNWVNTDPYFSTNVLNYYTSNDTITMYISGVTENNMSDFKVLVTTHGENFDNVPANATQLDTDWNDNIATAIYRPQNDKNYVPNKDVDVLFTYAGEVVYHITLNAFY